MYLFFEQERECESKRSPHGDVIESVDLKKLNVKRQFHWRAQGINRDSRIGLSMLPVKTK